MDRSGNDKGVETSVPWTFDRLPNDNALTAHLRVPVGKDSTDGHIHKADHPKKSGALL